MEVETSGEKEGGARVPLSEVVSDCVKRWFKDTLKEAKAGDVNMQVLVGQMYYSGYGVPRDAQKVSTLLLSWCSVLLNCASSVLGFVIGLCC